MAQAKVQLGQSMRFVGQQCVQLHGGIGVTDEYIGSHYFKRLTMLETELRRHPAPPRRGERADAGHRRRLRLTTPLRPARSATSPASPSATTPKPRADRLHRRALPQGAVCGVDVRGAAPGTRETDLLDPVNMVEQVHAVLLAGGSAFGLDAAGGVMRWLDEHGHGFASAPARVPIVPAAVLFDLWRRRAAHPARRRRGYAACERGQRAAPSRRAASAPAPAPRSASCSASARAMKGGIGSASSRCDGAHRRRAGRGERGRRRRRPGDGRIVAGARSADGTAARPTRALLRGDVPAAAAAGDSDDDRRRRDRRRC